MYNSLRHLAKVLMAAQQPDGTWLPPLDRLAEQVIKKCPTCGGTGRAPSYGGFVFYCGRCTKNETRLSATHGTGWVAADSAAWPVGGSYGMVRAWAAKQWWELPFLPRWLDTLRATLHRLIEAEETGKLAPEQLDPAALAAAVVAVEQMMEGTGGGVL